MFVMFWHVVRHFVALVAGGELDTTRRGAVTPRSSNRARVAVDQEADGSRSLLGSLGETFRTIARNPLSHMRNVFSGTATSSANSCCDKPAPDATDEAHSRIHDAIRTMIR